MEQNVGVVPRETRSTVRPRRGQAALLSIGVVLAAAVGVVQFVPRPPGLFDLTPPAHLGPSLPFATPAAEAFGQSGRVLLRMALPGQEVQFPLNIQGDVAALRYIWLRARDSASADTARPLEGATLLAPSEPGFYRLALVRDAERRIVDGLTLGVMVPFTAKLGATLDGYRIGTYLAERLGLDRHDHPPGFLRVEASDVDMPLTTHLRMADFLSHDGQTVWPRYAALDLKLLDKLELVFAEISRLRGADSVDLDLHVQSGFRTPAHNRLVQFAAEDSRHQYGDAADVALDADGDGKITAADTRLIGLAVEAVERDHPDLIGGMGLYLLRHTPYVHIDARGTRARWGGAPLLASRATAKLAAKRELLAAAKHRHHSTPPERTRLALHPKSKRHAAAAPRVAANRNGATRRRAGDE